MGNNQGKPVIVTNEVNLSQFRILRVVGKGAFGKVRIVKKKDTGLTFALKYIQKDEIVRSGNLCNIIRERRMLEHFNHPFHMYLVVDLMDGGDLRFHISRKTFTEEAVQFWVAELGCALKYIHKQGINLASGLTPGKPLTGKSGTLAYLAPEVYKGTGYGPGADWWSLGVLLYECIYNKRPFEGSTQTTLAGQVTKVNPAFPVTSPPVSLPCLGAISSALDENPTKRMGSAGFHSFTDNPFFRSIDFDALERKEIEPVFVPSSLKTNFDPIYDLEELLLEETPLEVLARRQRPRRLKDNATDKEIREYELFKMIETQFEPYNYEKSAYDRYAPDLHQPHPTLRLIVLPDTRIVSKRCPLTHANDRHPTKPSSNTISVRRRGSPPSERQAAQASSASSTSGSLPIPSQLPPMPNGPQQRQQPFSQNTNHRSNEQANYQTPNFSAPLSTPPSYQASYNRPQGGGIPNDATLPADEKANARRPPATLGFWNRVKGHAHSPKRQQRGILGKAGARVILASGHCSGDLKSHVF
ncbi:kinase-like domain-containing protein [Leptodontidium sp. MPI-SDFR-AT-0119]|nr:kinase-like domain-containing protein [Leptodontidium sp. MPI-SDFR-AT-0119]